VFDARFIPNFSGSPSIRVFDLMEENRDFVMAGWNYARGEWKTPSLKETLHHYFDVPLRGKRGDTLYHVQAMFAVFREMQRRAGLASQMVSAPALNALQ
jgi:hypothetical protein